MSLSSILKKKAKQIEIGTNTEGRKENKKSTFLCRKNSEGRKEKAFFICKSKMEAKDNMIVQEEFIAVL